MTFHLRSKVENSPVLKRTPKSVLGQLADASSDCGHCFVSIGRISLRAGLDRRTVQRALRWLEDEDYITTKSRLRKNGSTSTNEYYLNVPKIEQESVPESDIDENPSANPYLEGAAAHRRGGGSTPQGGRHDAAGNKDHINDHVNNTPQTPQEGPGDEVDISRTKNPHHKDYKLSKDEKDILVNEWNKIANGRFKLRKIFDSNCDRNLAKSYAAYKRNHQEGVHDGLLKTKLEFALTTMKGFSWWVDKTDNPSFYLRSASNKSNQWVAGLDYALRTSTYEKIINE